MAAKSEQSVNHCRRLPFISLAGPPKKSHGEASLPQRCHGASQGLLPPHTRFVATWA